MTYYLYNVRHQLLLVTETTRGVSDFICKELNLTHLKRYYFNLNQCIHGRFIVTNEHIYKSEEWQYYKENNGKKVA